MTEQDNDMWPEYTTEDKLRDINKRKRWISEQLHALQKEYEDLQATENRILIDQSVDKI